ncbi:MAG: winged helix-turn-helix domain-containing protein [Anaerolineae bacterium]|nr:winged helix-turn-helix domain-containing protein [Anaerolineae bacterium]
MIIALLGSAGSDEEGSSDAGADLLDDAGVDVALNSKLMHNRRAKHMVLLDSLRRYFTESLHWDTARNSAPLTFSLGEHRIEAHPLAQAGWVIAYGVIGDQLTLSRPLRRKVHVAIARRTLSHPLLVFISTKDDEKAIWRWRTSEHRSKLPPLTHNDAWLAELALPLHSTPSPEEVIQRLDKALLRRQSPSTSEGKPKPLLLAALDQLLHAVETTIGDASEIAKQAFTGASEVSFDEVVRLRESLQAFKEKANTLRNEAQVLVQEFPMLAHRREDGTLLLAARKVVPRGKRTPQSAYRCPILRALVQLGGKGTVRQVLDVVYSQISNRLSTYDFAPVSSGRDLVWKVAAKWERSKMKQEGLLRSDSPAGIWEITEAGRRYYQERCSDDGGSRSAQSSQSMRLPE